MIDLAEAKDLLEHLEPHLTAAHHDTMETWVGLVQDKPAFTLPLDPTTRATILHNHICADIEQRIASIAGVEATDALGFFALKVGSKILLRFKYVGTGAPVNVATEQQKLLARQTYDDQMMIALTGDTSLAPPTLVTVGYTIDGDQIGRIEVRCDCKGHVSWSYDIYGGEAVIAPQMLPGQEDTTKPARITRKIAAQGEDAAAANGAS
jgi:hypothetical protein